MGKQLVCQKYIYKIHSARLRREKWRLTLPLWEARRNDEVISLADSQVLRWIDELNGVTDADERARQVKASIREVRKKPYCIQNRREVRRLYDELDALQFKPDYLCLVIDREKDYHKACGRGFSVNGVRYRRLLGTNGGIKNSTIVFVSERLHPELDRRVNNGRDTSVEFVTAKLEAYKALTCSASVPVSLPRGVVVVDDVETSFTSDYIRLSDEAPGEPVMEHVSGGMVSMDASDGFGLMSPALAARWSRELGLGYTAGGMNTRFSFEKGMVFAFDFVEFAREYGTYAIKDAWGNEADLRDAELVLTTSMVKLWDSYPSCRAYVETSLSNGYTFAVTKTCPEELESLRALNYQFIQSYHLDDADIEELVSPTVNAIRDALGGDWGKTVLFLKGSGLNEKNAHRIDDDVVKAVMADPRAAGDPYVRSVVYQAIRNRINEAKVGVIDVHGNYSIASGDPFALCQHICGLEVTGLLKAGQVYNRYWAKDGAGKLACFRAPMTCHNNIRLVEPVRHNAANYWYKYMGTCTVFNAWDTAACALNGMDFDGDLVMLTDNPVLVRKLEPMPALMCAQRKAQKGVPSEEDFIRSNIESFGTDIGQTTNWITSMFEVQSRFDPESEEYAVLDYRIRCGELYQQNAIDKAKGIICKPMPKTWHDRHAVSHMEDSDTKDLYRCVVADRKPYFMRYIYPQLMNQYNTYIKNAEKNSMREFCMTVDELRAIPEGERTERQSEFLYYYDRQMPVGTGDCVMNKICRIFEREFDGYIKKHSQDAVFDYGIYKTGAGYTKAQYQTVKRLYDDYNKRLRNYKVYAAYEKVDRDESRDGLALLHDWIRRECDEACTNSDVLCDIILDICYTKSTTRAMAWGICGHEIIANMLDRRGGVITIPVADQRGDIEYLGNRYTLKPVNIRGSHGDHTEREQMGEGEDRIA